MRATYLRLAQLLTGVLILFLLGWHLVLLHLGSILGFLGITAGSTDFSAMLDRSRDILFAVLYIALLAVVLYHALLGLRDIIFELSPSVKAERIINWTIGAFGIIFFILGTYVPIALLSN